MGYLLGLDLGTSALKALLCDERGRIKRRFMVPYQPTSPRPGWVEQDPEQWWEAVLTVFSQLNELKIHPIIAIGLTGQMHGPVFVGPGGRPLYPCIIWADTRAHDELSMIKKRLTHEKILRTTGNPPTEAFTAPKILWFKRHHPDLFRRVVKVLLPKDFVGFKLTGEYFTDHTDASGTLLYDIRAGDWSQDFLSALDLSLSIFPTVKSSTSIAGYIRVKMMGYRKILEGTPVVVGAGDLATAVFGSGVEAKSSALINIGTAGQVMVVQETFPKHLGSSFLFRHPLGGFFRMGTIPAAGASLQWYRQTLKPLTKKEITLDDISELAEQSPPGSNGLFFLPYLFGTGTPHLDYRARGAFIGLTAKHSQADIVRAIMEGVAYGLKDCLLSLGVEPKEVRLGSGGARSTVWQQIITNVLGVKVAVLKEKDLSAYGACLLAGLALGVFGNFAEVKEMVQVEKELFPSAEPWDVYEQGYRVYKSLYRALRDSFQRINKLFTLRVSS